MFNESIKRSLSTEQQTTSQNLQGANNTPFSLKMITSFSVTTQGCIATQLLQSLATTCRDKGCWHFQIMRTWPCKAWTIVLPNPSKNLGRRARWEKERKNATSIGTQWEQEPKSGTRMGTKWEQEPKSETRMEQEPNRKTRMEISGNKVVKRTQECN